MRILSTYYMHKKGGFCKRLYRMLNALAERGHEVHFVTLDPHNSALSPKIHLHPLSFPINKRNGILFWLVFSLYLPWALLWYAFRHKIQRIPVFGPYYAVAGALSSFLLGAPLILFIRSKLTRPRGSTLFEQLAEKLLKLCDYLGLVASSRVVCQTESIGEEVKDRVPISENRELIIIPNDIGKLNERERSADRFIALTSAVFAPLKNLELLLEAWKQLELLGIAKETELLIAGEGRGIEAAKEQAKKLELSTVSFLGWVEDMPALLSRVHMYLHPSLHEGMSNSLLEALAAGVAVLAADTPEQRELLKNEELLFVPTPQILADTLARAVANANYLNSLRDLSRERALIYQFDWEKRVEEAILK